ncbi:NAD(P)-binding protein [Gymnopus androsaceus JB14]|uniref:NAD(P)-binding protein n=1 Tax=Gymnopus androsaceus JB14 TaxID=1447944 RepID=A0A6A4IVN9_9AGAR|nr:NAD(P)-binding protein [Gymnopus androsaceus JB14]
MRGFLVKEIAHHTKINLSYDVPEPQPKKNEVLVDVYSGGLNFFDILQTQGKYQVKPPLPFVLGAEFAGRIAKDSPIPPGCSFKPGDRVFGAGQGAYADKMVVKVESLLPLPDELSYDQGAGLYVTWPTSYEALVGRAQLKPGEWVLVTAAAGGVGIAAVQLAKVLGGKVIAAAGSQEKLDIAKRYGGADHVINYTKPDWQKEVLKITNGKGVDVVYDPVGMIQASLKCIAWKGRALVVGFAAGSIEKIPMNLVLLKNISLVGVHWGAYARHEAKQTGVVWKALLELFASGKVKPVIYSEVFTLENLSQGLAALEHRKTYGKTIVTIRKDDKAVSAKL